MKFPIVELTAFFGTLITLLAGISRLISESRDNKRSNEKTAESLEEIKGTINSIKDTAKSNSEEIAKVANGTKTLHRYRLFHDMSEDVLRGYTTLERKREMAKLFESYKLLDGNGEIELLYHEFVELPLKEEIKDEIK